MAEQESAVGLQGSRREQLAQWLSDHWARIAVIFVFLALWAYTLIAIRPLPLDEDAALFLHAGWYINHGARLYIDIWEIKPPLPYIAGAILSWLSGGNLHLQYALGLLANVAGYVGLVILARAIVLHYTGSRQAGFTAGGILFLFVIVTYFPFTGFRVKSIAIALGWLGVYLQLRDRPFWSGISAAAAVGFWQLGVVFALIVFVQSLRDMRRFLYMASGAVIMSVLVLLPIVVWGAVPSMIEQAIFSHLKTSLPQSLLICALKLVFHLRVGFAVLVLGLYGLCRVAIKERHEMWLLAVILAWSLISVLVLDYDGKHDLLPLIVVACIGLGLIVDQLPARQGTAITIAATIAVVASFQFREPYVHPRMQAMFWNREIPTSCHYRLSRMELQYIERYGDACPEPQWAIRWP